MEWTPQVVVLLIGLGVAAVTDARTGRIPNALTFPMMVLGIVIHATLGPDRWLGLLGCGAALAVHYPLWTVGVEKAGDAKLMMGLGACLGWREMVEASFWLAILYLPIGLLMLAVQGKLSNLVATARWTLRKAQGQDAGEKPEATWLRTGPIIAVGGVLAWLTSWLALPV